MMRCIKNELKIMGVNPVLLSGAVVAVFSLSAVFVGDLLNLSCIGFEVVFPFFAAIAVGEWGKSGQMTILILLLHRGILCLDGY